MGPADTTFACHVLRGTDFTVTAGANLGDPLGPAEDLTPGDTYRLAPEARTHALLISDGDARGGEVLHQDSGGHLVAAASDIGRPNTPISLTAKITCLAPEGHKVDLLLLSLEDGEVLVLPIDPMEPGVDHTLVGVDPRPGAVRLADITSIAFARGTRIAMADGRQVPVEALEIGDQILTRDHGAQSLRWIARRTLRGVGPHAPVVIPANTFGNPADLVVSQHQRLFVYQRSHERLTPTAEMLVKAHHLVDAQSIFIRSGGFVDFFSLVLDRHEMIYAECIPVESLLLRPETLRALPQDLAQEVGNALPNVEHQPHVGIEADRRTAEATRSRLLRRRDRSGPRPGDA